MIAVFGAGSIGCHVGGALAAAGAPVTLIGRERLQDDLSTGLTVATLDGRRATAAPGAFDVVAEAGAARALAAAEMILVTVKSGDTGAAAAAIAAHGAADALVVSLQNGVENAGVLADALGADRVSAGMVAFNVIRPAPDRFVQATAGAVTVDRRAAALVEALAPTLVAAEARGDMEAVQWSKLLMNLNNPLNLLSGLGLRAQLRDRGWRRVLAACMAEGLALARAEAIPLVRLGKAPPRLAPFILRLPDAIFTSVADSMLRVDPAARTSMVDDYERGRPSEIAWLNGFVATRAAAQGLPAPVNARVTATVERAFADPSRPPLSLSPDAFLG